VIRATSAQHEVLCGQRSQNCQAHQQIHLTANIEAPDDGKTIVGGNERVIRARLSDAKFSTRPI